MKRKLKGICALLICASLLASPTYADVVSGETVSTIQDSSAKNSGTQNPVAQDSASQNPATQDAATQDSAVQNSATQDSAVQNSATQDSAVQNSATQDSAVQNSATQDSATQTQNPAAQDSATQNPAAQDSTTQDSTTQTSEPEILETQQYSEIETFAPSVRSILPGVTAQVDAEEQTVIIHVTAESLSGEVAGVLFPTWSDVGGQDDIGWYGGARQPDGSWQVQIPIVNHRTAGTYTTHVYTQKRDGTVQFIDGVQFAIHAPKAEVTLGEVNEESGSFLVTVSNLNTISPVQSVLVPVWHAPDQSDICWYGASRQADGSYQVEVNIRNHAYHTGVYQVHTYVQTANGILTCVNTNKTEVNVTYHATAAVSQDEKTVRVTLDNTELFKTADSVLFPTWSISGGQDDIGWYGGSKDSTGQWSINIPISNHKTAGEYLTHIYASMGGNLMYLTGVRYTIHASTAKVTIGTPDKETGSFTVTVTDVDCKSGVQYLWVPIWSAANQSDINWYLGVRQPDGSYKVEASPKNHGYHTGEYQVHTYIQAENGLMTCVNTGKTSIDLKPEVETKVSTDEKTVTVTLKNSGLYTDAAGVLFPTWSDAGGQDDIGWYGGSKNSGGQWTINISISNHKTAGSYTTHLYAQNRDGSLHYITGVKYTIKAATGQVVLGTPDRNQGTLKVRLSNISAASGVDAVQVPVWSEPNQSDIYWYTATKTGADTYEANINISRHSLHTGIYQVHAYVRSQNGIMTCIFTGSTVLTSAQAEQDSSRIARMSVAANCTQLVTVTGESNGVRLKYYEKENGSWYRKLDTDARIGARGFSTHPTEGSNTTPLGCFDFGIAFGNKSNPGTSLSWVDVNPYHWWIDDPSSSHYNQMVDTRFVGRDWNSGEYLSAIVPDYNYAINMEVNPRGEQNSCSAIFLHAKGRGSSTAGCIAVDESVMVYILQHMKAGAKIVVANNSDELLRY